MQTKPVPHDFIVYCSVCGEKASVYGYEGSYVLPFCSECESDATWSGYPIALAPPPLLQQPKGTHWVIVCIWATLFAALIFLAAFKAIELINPPPIPVPVIGERFTEHEKDHLTLLSQVAAQDLLDQSLLPENERDREGEERIANAMRWAESHSNSPFADQ